MTQLAGRQATLSKRLRLVERKCGEPVLRLRRLEQEFTRLQQDARIKVEQGGQELEELRENLAWIEDTIEEERQTMQNMLENSPTDSGFSEAAETGYGNNPTAVKWSVDQLLGEPDTETGDDHPTAWAPMNENGGIQWAEVEFEEARIPTELLIRESHNPGAVMSVEAVDTDGNYHVIWEGDDPTRESPGDFVVDLRDADFFTQSVKIYLDTNKVEGWNEIDAVGLMTGEETQWGVRATASSSYSEVYTPPDENSVEDVSGQ